MVFENDQLLEELVANGRLRTAQGILYFLKATSGCDGRVLRASTSTWIVRIIRRVIETLTITTRMRTLV